MRRGTALKRVRSGSDKFFKKEFLFLGSHFFPDPDLESYALLDGDGRNRVTDLSGYECFSPPVTFP